MVLDLDGVFANFVKAANLLTGREPDFQPKEYSYLNEGELGSVKRVRNFWLHHVEPYHDNVQQLLDNLKVDDEVYFCTNRLRTAGLPTVTQTMMWLRKWCGENWPVVVCGTARDKARLARMVGADALLDDYPSVIRRCAGAPFRPFILNRPWNMNDVSYDMDPYRVGSINEFFEKARQANG
jgi:hypothetical protein